MSQTSDSPTTSLTVRLSPDFLKRISELIARIGLSEIKAGTEIVGPLFGTRAEGFVTVQAFRLVPVHDLRAGRVEYFDRSFARLVPLSKTDPELKALRLIGWCCIRSSDSKGFLESDVAFHNLRFQHPDQIALLLRPQSESRISIELYAASHTAGSTVDVSQAVPVDLAIEVKKERPADAVSAGQIAAVEKRVEGVPPPVLEPDLSPPLRERISSALSVFTQRRAKGPIALAALLIVALTAAGIFVAVRRPKPSSGNVSRPLSLPNASSPQLGMKVEAQPNDRLLVTWNRESPIVQSAKYGILYIDDGPQHREVDFGPGEMLGGSILYRPASDNVTFRLQVLGRDEVLISESVRVLDGSMGVALSNKPASSKPKPPLANLPSNPAPQHGSAEKPALTDTDIPRTRREPTESSPAPANGGTNAVPEPKPPIASIPKPQSSITSPPKLSITTSPVSAKFDLHSLPAAPSPAGAPPSAETPIPVKKAAQDFKPPRPRTRVLPDTIHLSSSDLDGIRQVQVDVKIDERGHVTSAAITPDGKAISQTLAASLIQAAKQWTFSPALTDGKPTASQHTIVFDFQSQPR